MEKFRKLSSGEISLLEKRQCQADDWDTVKVKDGFSPLSLFNVSLSGSVTLGLSGSAVDTGYGILKPAGIYNTTIKNCRIGDNVYISQVRNLTGYEIAGEAVIENVDRLQVDSESTFGNGVEIEVLNANGNRKFPMFNLLSAQLAYLMTTYRQDARFNQKLDELIRNYVDSTRSATGRIGRKARLSDCGIIRNVNIGASAVLSGVKCLTEGSVISNASAPVFLGDGVIARHFIIQSGSVIDSQALIDKSFIGQGVQVGKQFSAENSLIFANSECFHGEACNIFAGPFSVTHHKSTLLIAAMFSFFNAGSGSNQSNHMYKLGPIHQGIVERGSKTGSFSYLMWPSRIGAFSIVLGKHMTNFDSAVFPFSYILEDNGHTTILPALNFFTAGTKRDSVKWQRRDRRKDPEKLDLINFQLLSPFIIEKIIKALEILRQLENELTEDAKFITYQGMQIEKTRIKKSIEDYQSILQIYFGEELLRRLEQEGEALSEASLQQLLQPGQDQRSVHWIDAAGMIVPIEEIRKIFTSLGQPTLTSIEELQTRFKQIDAGYGHSAWQWCLSVLRAQTAGPGKSPDRTLLIRIIEDWRNASQKALRRIMKDAAKEFAQKSRIGYGLNGDQKMQDLEFEAIVGSYEDNRYVKELQAELDQVSVRADKMLSLLQNIR